MKEINDAYDRIRKADPDNPRWKYLNYEFRGPANDVEAELAAIFGYSSVAQLDCYRAEIRKAEKLRGPRKIGTGNKSRYSFSADGKILDTDIGYSEGFEFDAEESGYSMSEMFRSDFYLQLDMGMASVDDIFGCQVELEDLLISIARKNKSRIHPLLVRPTLKYYEIESAVEPRIDEFCEMLSKEGVSSKNIIRS